MKKLLQITKAKSKWAKQMVKEYGPIVQFADEKMIDGLPHYRFVSPIEDDIKHFRNWSYWVPKAEIDVLEIKL